MYWENVHVCAARVQCARSFIQIVHISRNNILENGNLAPENFRHCASPMNLLHKDFYVLFFFRFNIGLVPRIVIDSGSMLLFACFLILFSFTS